MTSPSASERCHLPGQAVVSKVCPIDVVDQHLMRPYSPIQAEPSGGKKRLEGPYAERTVGRKASRPIRSWEIF